LCQQKKIVQLEIRLAVLIMKLSEFLIAQHVLVPNIKYGLHLKLSNHVVSAFQKIAMLQLTGLGCQVLLVQKTLRILFFLLEAGLHPMTAPLVVLEKSLPECHRMFACLDKLLFKTACACIPHSTHCQQTRMKTEQ
jgi:hypothetical protein